MAFSKRNELARALVVSVFKQFLKESLILNQKIPFTPHSDCKLTEESKLV